MVVKKVFNFAHMCREKTFSISHPVVDWRVISVLFSHALLMVMNMAFCFIFFSVVDGRENMFFSHAVVD